MESLIEDKKDKLVTLLEDANFDDGTDISVYISLFDCGFIRRKLDGLTLFCFYPDDENISFCLMTLNHEEIINYLEYHFEKFRDEKDKGFFEFVGYEPVDYLIFFEDCKSDNLFGSIISDLKTYGYISDDIIYSLTIDDVIQRLNK